MRETMRDSNMFDVIARLLRSQARFYGGIIAFGGVGIVVANGWSWTSAIVIAIAAIVIPFGWVLIAFWISVFRNMGRRGDIR